MLVRPVPNCSRPCSSLKLLSCALQGWQNSLCYGQVTSLVQLLVFLQKKAFRAYLGWWAFLLCYLETSCSPKPITYFSLPSNLFLPSQVFLSQHSLSHWSIFPSLHSSFWKYLPLKPLCHVHPLASWSHPLGPSHQVDHQPRPTDHPLVHLGHFLVCSPALSFYPKFSLAVCPLQGFLRQLCPLSSLYGAGKAASVPGDSDDSLKSFKRNQLQSKLKISSLPATSVYFL